MPNQKVEIVTSKFTSMMQGFGYLGQVAAAAQTGFAVYNLIKGGGKSDTDRMIEAIERMTRELVAKLQEVADVGRDGTRINLWSKNRAKLIECKTKIVARAREFATYDQFTHRVVVDGDWVSVAAWCKPDTGALADLHQALRDISLLLSTSTFETKNAIEEWDDLVKSGTVYRVLGLTRETRFSLMFAWFQSICSIVQMATYVYNAALTLYRQASLSGEELADLDKALDDLWGREVADLDTMLEELGRMSYVDAEGKTQPGYGVWAIFEAKFEEILTTSINEDSDNRAYINSYSDPADHLAEFSRDHRFLSGGFGMDRDANCYVAGLEIDYSKQHSGWRLMATVVKVNDDGSSSVWREATDDPKIVADWGMSWDRGGWIPAYTRLGAGAVRPPDVALSHNEALVVTGYCIAGPDDARSITLAFGRLTIGPEGKITVARLPDALSSLPRPDPHVDTFMLRHDVDKLHRGIAGTRSLFPLTEASFGRVNKYELNVRAGCGWRAFRADVFQPAYLKRYSPKLPGEAGETELWPENLAI
ncbi:MAG: hypothetical protein JO013_16755 [Alphaproteobacteria bacterium]|nr:hypothetical protein [Alphaproteobacteria bacterium]